MLLRWSGRVQTASLILGGLLIAIGAVLPWLHNTYNNPAGLSFDEGKIAFALGLQAVLMGSLRIIDRTDLLRWLTVVIGFSLGVAAIVLAFMKMMDIRSLQNVLGFLPISVGVGLYLTMAGGVVTAVGSLFGIVPDRPARSEQFKWVPPPQDSIGEPASDLR